jgi:hypothetical protein
MAEGQMATMSDDEQLELVCWLIERHDHLRASTASRAAIVVSADAILCAGAVFLLDQYLSSGTQYDEFGRVVFTVGIGANLALLALSIALAANAVAFVWKKTRTAVGIRNLPPLLFFHPSDTVKAFKGDEFGRFRQEFRAATKEQVVTYALGELMQITIAHNMRYRAFRWSIRLLFAATVPMSICILILLLRHS